MAGSMSGSALGALKEQIVSCVRKAKGKKGLTRCFVRARGRMRLTVTAGPRRRRRRKGSRRSKRRHSKRAWHKQSAGRSSGNRFPIMGHKGKRR